MANVFTKFVSGLDFWDKKENQQQRQTFADQDAQARKRKQQQAANQVVSGVPAPGSVIAPTTAPTVPKLSDQIGSQSQFSTTNNKIDFTKPLVPAQAVKPKTATQQGTDEIDQLTKKNLPAAQKQQGDSWLDRNVLHRGAGDARAEVQARNQALREYQDKHGYNKQPEVMAAQNENHQALGRLSEQDAAFARHVNTVSKVADKAGQVAQYIPVTGSVLNLGLAGADAATGHNDQDIKNTRSKLDFGMTAEEFDKLPKAQQDKLQNIREIGLGLSPLDFTGVGGFAKSEGVTAAKKGIVQLAKHEAIDQATKDAIKAATKGTLKRAIVPAVVGAGASAAGQQYLTGKIDPLEALKSGALVAGTSMLVPEKTATNLNKDIVHAGEDLTDPRMIGAETTGLVAAKTIADAAGEAKEAANVPGRANGGAKAPEGPTNEISPGVSVASPQDDVDKTPAYQRGIPTTVGEADTQNNLMGSTNLPDSAFDADLRVAKTPTDTPEEAALDVPTFMRNQADERAGVAQQNIDSIDQRLANTQTSPQIQAFQDKQAIAAAYRESPTKGKAVERYIAARNERVGTPGDATPSLIGDRRIATQDLNAAQNAASARDLLANPINVPDPANPIALAPVDETAGAVSPTVTNPADEGAPIADFSKAMDTPLRPAVAATDAPAPVAATAQGNVPLQSDAAAVANGTLDPTTTPTVTPQVAPEEQMSRAAAATARDQVQLDRASDSGKALSETLGSGSLYGKDVRVQTTQAGLPKEIHGTVISSAGGAVRRAEGNMFASGENYVASGTTVIRDGNGKTYELDNSQIEGVKSAEKPLSEQEQMIAGFRASQQPARGDTAAAPRTYDRLMQQIQDPELRNELSNEIPGMDSINIEQEQAKARTLIGGMSDEQLIDTFRNGIDTNTPQGFFQSIPLLNRLGRSDVLEQSPEARDIVDKITTQVALKKSTAGQTLRSSQVLFENMPPVMKRETLLKSLGQAGADMTDTDRGLFLRLIERSDDADSAVSDIQDQAKSLMADMESNPGALNGPDAPAFQERIDQLHDAMSDAKASAGTATSDAVKFYDAFKPKGSFGSQVADTGRSLMLSGIGGRVFDNLSTAATAVNDIATSNVSAGVGKLINKVKGDGTVIDSGMSGHALLEGTKQGAKEVIDSFRGKGRNETSLESFTKGGDPNRSGVAGQSGFRGFVNNVVDIPTKLSRGIETARQEQLGRQEAQQLGLQGDEVGMYAQLRSLAPTDQQRHDSVQLHMRANNLHENFVTDKLNSLTRALSASRLGKENPKIAGIVDTLVKNQIAPFTSFLGGSAHRAITDKNVLYNVVKGGMELKRGNLQGFADQMGNLGVNTTQAMAGGYLLAQAGLITDKDANGNDYAGGYLHIGDRYIPLSIMGASSTPLIMGASFQQANQESDNPSDIITNTITKAFTNTGKAVGVSGVFGGDNNLQQNVAQIFGDSPNGAQDGLTKYGSGVIRQYANPAIFGDINAALNNGLPFGLNPNGSGVAPQIKETKTSDNGRDVTDVQATEKNRILAGIPGISQGMERDETGKPATDLLDRGLKSNRETGDMKQSAAKQQSLDDVAKQLKQAKISTKDDDLTAYMKDGEYDKAQKVLDYKLKEEQSKADPSESKIKKLQDQKTQADLGADGVPVTDDGIKARTEDGDYDSAMKGLQYQIDKTKDDKNVPTSTKQKAQDQLTRLKVAKEKNYTPDTIAAYDKTSNAEWRDMGDPESDDYDPQTYALLAQYDADLAANGVSASTKDGKTQKFYNKGTRGGSGGGSGKGVATSIAMQTFQAGGGFTPIKAQAADFSNPSSVIPDLQPVPINDRSKQKKITVSGGF